MKWTDEAITELKTILRFDPTGILARHDLALCYRNMGWPRESLEEMRKANEYAATYGNTDEKEVVKTSLNHIEDEVKSGDEDGTKRSSYFSSCLQQPTEVSRENHLSIQRDNR